MPRRGRGGSIGDDSQCESRSPIDVTSRGRPRFPPRFVSRRGTGDAMIPAMARKTHGDLRASPRGAGRRDTKRGITVIPRPGDADFEDVHWALSAASTLWERGEDVEALKWL